MKKLDKKNIIRLVAVVIFLIVTIALTIVIVPVVMNISTPEGRASIQKSVDYFGAFGWVIFLGIQILQVVVALIPGEPIEIMGGLLFGTFKGLLLCQLGLLIGTIAVFYLVKFIGKPIVNAFVSDDDLNKFKILRDERKLETFVFLLFLVPGTPKDTLTYIIPLTKIKPSKFFILSTIARIPSVVSSTLVGENLSRGEWFWTIIIFVITALAGLLGIYVNGKIIKKREEKLAKKENLPLINGEKKD
ncbi:MAG: VTT domain-containing protein [Oscillospiraceae bacterium]